MLSNAFFVTGTDTEVGKTAISCALLYKAHQQGLTTAASKPVACGTEMTPEGARNEDAVALHRQCHPPLKLSEINPLLFDAPTSPHIAAAEAGTSLSVDGMVPLIHTILNVKRQLTLVEGAGGWHVPINAEENLSDVAVALGLPIVVVVGIKLGALNHALLTYEALKRAGLPIAGWVANSVAPPPPAHCLDQYLDILHHRLDAPCLGIVPFMDAPQPERIAPHLDLQPLLR